jgi:hypothetical protein
MKKIGDDAAAVPVSSASAVAMILGGDRSPSASDASIVGTPARRTSPAAR